MQFLQKHLRLQLFSGRNEIRAIQMLKQFGSNSNVIEPINDKLMVNFNTLKYCKKMLLYFK